MKKRLFLLLLLLLSFVYPIYAYNPDISYTLGLFEAEKEFNDLRDNMKAIVYLLENKGLKALKDNKDIDMSSAYVIAPVTGKVLLGPSGGKESYFNINGKEIAKYTIRQWKQSRDDNFFEEAAANKSNLYNILFSSIAITDSGNLYVVVIGKKDINLERMFIKRLLDKAIETIEAEGMNNAMTIFDSRDNIFRTDNTYVFIYDDKSKCIFNPNFPELLNKTPDEMGSNIGKVVKDFLAIAAKDKEGWLSVPIREPLTDKEVMKDIFVKRFFYDGRYYVIGSGVYTE